MDRIELLKLLGMTEAEAEARNAEEDRMRAVFAKASIPNPVNDDAYTAKGYPKRTHNGFTIPRSS